MRPGAESARGRSFQEPALAKDFQDQFLKREVRRRPDVSQLILSTIGLDGFAILRKLGFISSQQRRRDRDLASRVAFCIDKEQFASQRRIDLLMTCNVDDEDVVTK